MNFIQNETPQKLRGGYYTPKELAYFISRWVIECKSKKILEPSCGDGVFVDTLNDLSESKYLVDFFGVEINKEEASKAQKRAQNCNNVSATIIVEDFLFWVKTNLYNGPVFDAVIGNPPFIRYQYLTDQMQAEAEFIFNALSIKFTKHTNAWVPFVLASIYLLKPGGRLGMIVPAELLHVIHAQAVRNYLSDECSQILIIDPEDIWFDGTLQGAIILLAQKKNNASERTKGLAIKKTKGLDFTMQSPSELFTSAFYTNGSFIKGKWTYALLSIAEFGVYQSLRNNDFIKRFDSLADVDVGIVTGANEFFLVNDERVKEYQLEEFVHPMFGRSDHCPGVIYDDNQQRENVSKGLPTNFIWINKNYDDLLSIQKKYIDWGVEQSLHTRYKCRIREPWFTVPSVYSTQLCMLKRSNGVPRLIVNKLNALTTDTAYRIRLIKSDINPELIAFSFINSITALSAELEGRHYGGGVLELVPSEIEKLYIPYNECIIPNIDKLDRDIRKLCIDDILHDQDDTILKGIGLSQEEIIIIQQALIKLKSHRLRISSDA